MFLSFKIAPFMGLFFLCVNFLNAAPKKEKKPLDRRQIYCSRFEKNGSLASFLRPYTGRIYSKNDGGFFNQGVCWWHSRFQRASAYLSYFVPEAEAVKDPEEIRKIVRAIIGQKDLVLINGFNNMLQFSYAWKEIIQEELEKWQLRDSLHGKWINGLKGKWTFGPQGYWDGNAKNMEKTLDQTYELFLKGQLPFQILQIPGIEAHAWLIRNMVKTKVGYQLSIIDSNQGEEEYEYKRGMNFITYREKRAVLYSAFEAEAENLQQIFRKYCQ